MAEENKKNSMRDVYDDTVYFIDSLISSYDVFPNILGVMRQGKATIEMKKRYMLRAIDEAWVSAIEESLPALDIVIRSPSKYIEEVEEILPIERTKTVSTRSLQHLSMHTNLISKVEGDKITPSKLLNVKREETLQTYENKFINTLINRLYLFVSRRYEIAKRDGRDEKSTTMNFNQEFTHGKIRGKIHFGLEVSEDVGGGGGEEIERNYTQTTDIWRRVERLYGIVSSYAECDFVRQMGKNYVRPPIMRTNAILKNKNLHQCLELWQFIESYENAGYSLLVQETLESVDDEYLKQLYSTIALQYMIFRYNVRNDFEMENVVAEQTTDNVISPKVIDELKAITENEFSESAEPRKPEMPARNRYGTLTPLDKMYLQSLQVALDADEVLRGHKLNQKTGTAYIPEPDPAGIPSEDDYPSPENAGAEEKAETPPPSSGEKSESAGEPDSAAEEKAEDPLPSSGRENENTAEDAGAPEKSGE